MREFKATSNDQGVRLSRFVESVTTGFSGSLLHKHFRNKRIKVNGKRQTPDYRIQAGDTIQLYVNDEFFPAAAPKPNASSLPSITIQVVWENESLAILYKPQGLVCHSPSEGEPSLLSGFQQYLEAKGEYSPHSENRFSPALCNRLDQGTEGLVIGAKTYPALRDANTLLREDAITKKYLCVTYGTPPQGIKTAYILRDGDSKISEIRDTSCLHAKKISTGIQVLDSLSGFSLCEISLLTGRTHQIRAHLAHLGCPIVGDRKYKPATTRPLPDIQNQLLCAYKLSFPDHIPETSSIAALRKKEFITPECAPQTWWEHHKATLKPCNKKTL